MIPTGLFSVLFLAPIVQSENLTSGRPLPLEQAVYDVLHYRLAVRVDPGRKSIEGRCEVSARFLEETGAVSLDLDDRLDVRSVHLDDGSWGNDGGDGRRARFRHEDGEIRIRLPSDFAKEGSEFRMIVDYGGKPRVAPRPPWDGGFVWAETPSGEPWVATANQMQGADLWWPCKDQPDDEPEGMDILVTVPVGLVCASNGRLVETWEPEKDWTTYHWRVSTPINAYGVALNIAPYETISTDYTSVAGDTFPITYWVLPENREKGEELFEDILRQVRFFEETFGPYPFRADKYGVAETPYLGMEHQSIIAYGNGYAGNPWGSEHGFDFLHHHEMAHEWWANLVTARNWNDFWIHEGFATYAQALYCEHLGGSEAYRREMGEKRPGIANRGTVAPREPRHTRDMYFGDRPGSPGGDIYNKGSWILHTLRFVLGDETFFKALRRMAYPDPDKEKLLDGSACRFTTTDEILGIAEEVSGEELDWFFELYLRQPELPRLLQRRRGDKLHLEWDVPGDLSFPMPVEIRVGDELLRVEMGQGDRAVVDVGEGADVEVDPYAWILKTEPRGSRR